MLSFVIRIAWRLLDERKKNIYACKKYNRTNSSITYFNVLMIFFYKISPILVLRGNDNITNRQYIFSGRANNSKPAAGRIGEESSKT